MNFLNILKLNYKMVLLVVLLAFGSCSFTTKTFSDPDKDKTLIQMINYVVKSGHFNPADVDDSFSEVVFTAYLEQIDPFKRYFLESDIKEFEKYKTELDDQIKSQELTFFNLTHNRLVERIEDAKAIYEEVLEKPFDYSVNETFSTDYENLDYVKNKRQLKDRWRKQLKFSSIANYDDLIEEQNSQKENTDNLKTLEQLEQEAREATLNSLDVYFTDYIDDLDREDWFAIFINSYVEAFDPHSFYFPPNDKDRFDQQISGKLEGIGARLQKRMDQTKIVDLISGGPAWQGGELEVGDVILKVRQDDEERPVNIEGMRLDDAIQFIKGPKGTVVHLTVKKVDGTIQNISITRDVVEIEETYAKTATVKKDDKTFGIINLPKFYVDFKDYNKRNAASDVKKEIERLKAEGMDGLVLDLRNNGGGSLQTVVDMAGLFISEGPVVQVRSSNNEKSVLKDRDRAIDWDGPLVILVNELSASASEILAAAMQDYKRAIIIGSKQTYGKGTVQNVLDLNNLLRNNTHGDFGALKLTTQKFYRINGGSTQLEGVKSDVVVPDRYSYIDIGEKDLERPLEWDKISPVEYNVWNDYFDYDKTISKSKERMAANKQLMLIEENAKWVRSKMDEKTHSLNYDRYRSQIELNEKQAKRYEQLSDYTTNLSFESLPYEKQIFETDSVLEKKRDFWHKALSQDVYVEEALNVLNDLEEAYSIKKVATIKD